MQSLMLDAGVLQAWTRQAENDDGIHYIDPLKYVQVNTVTLLLSIQLSISSNCPVDSVG